MALTGSKPISQFQSFCTVLNIISIHWAQLNLQNKWSITSSEDQIVQKISQINSLWIAQFAVDLYLILPQPASTILKSISIWKCQCETWCTAHQCNKLNFNYQIIRGNSQIWCLAIFENSHVVTAKTLYSAARELQIPNTDSVK